MLTSTCDSCHETMSFEDQLAGMTVRCKQCGEGWVHVPRTSVNASVSGFTDKGSTSPRDLAVTDQRPMTVSAPLWDHPPAAGTCPQCGSSSFTRVNRNDRECKECGIHYTTIPAPMSSSVAVAMYASGVLLLLGGVMAVFIRLAQAHGPGVSGAGFSWYGILFSVMMAFGVMRMPQQTQQLREKRLKEYQKSAPPGAPPPVELPRLPDTVSVSILFGTLSLISPLVSSLLLVLLFAPAAVVCGLVALTLGHFKGLIGVVLGIVSLIVWGLVFVYLFQG